MNNQGFFTATFNVDIAKEFGTDAAIILSNIQFWCRKNKANNKNFHEGEYWTYNSKDAFTELFPYLTIRQVETILTNLKKNGLIKTANFNPKKYDKTLWYTVDEKVYKSYLTPITQNGGMDTTERCDAYHQNVVPIPDTYKILNTDNNSCATSYTFEQFWNDYGVKKNKHEAERKFNKLSQKDRLHIQKILPQFKLDTPDIAFRKHPTTFLNQKTWLDYEVEAPKSTNVTPMTDDERYWSYIARIPLKPMDNGRFSLEERRFIINYQATKDRFPPDDRKLVQDTCSLTRAEIDQKNREEGWIV